MYAVIQTGGKQHRVQVGEVVHIESLPAEAGRGVVFARVLMVGQGDNVKIGSPALDGAVVRGTVVEQGRGKKILVFTYKKRKNASRRRGGHRQNFTAVKIDAIEA